MSISTNNFTIYTKTSCPYCDKIKTVLKTKGGKYTEYILGEHFTKEQFQSEFGEAATFPQIICGDLRLGGCSEAVQYFMAMGWV